MESQRFLQKITEFARTVVHKRADQQEKFSIAQAGVICCRHRQQIREVPFLQPCLVLVLAGQKILYHGDREIRCDRGNYFAIPAPAQFNMINVPDAGRQMYLALCISFDAALIDRFRQLYNHGADGLEHPNSPIGRYPASPATAGTNPFRVLPNGSATGFRLPPSGLRKKGPDPDEN